MKYYTDKLYLAQVDKNDNVTGQVERWEAHKKGILHRGFTVILFYGDKIVLQHRRHPAFDKFWDLSFSSHQIYKNNSLQNNREAIGETLKREWNIDKNGLKRAVQFLGKIYYRAKDPNSIYTEHEFDYIYSAELKNTPNPNSNYAYGFELIDNSEFSILNSKFSLTPWVEKIIAEIAII